MKYLVAFNGEKESPFHHAKAEHLKAAKEKLEAALKDKSLDCCYHKVGGGGFMVVNSSSHESLTRILRKYALTDVDVHPLIDTRDLIDGYVEHKSKADNPQWVKDVHKATDGRIHPSHK